VPASSARLVLEDLGINTANQGASRDLAGTDVLAHVAPSVALLTVHAQPLHEDDEIKLLVTTQCSWHGKLKPKRADEQLPAAAANSFSGNSDLMHDKINRYGKALSSQGNPLPYLLVTPSKIIIEPLSPHGAFTWRHEESITLALPSAIRQSLQHHAAGFPPLPTLVPQMALSRWSFPPRPSSRLSEPAGDTCSARYCSTYTVVDRTDQTATIRKTFQLKTTGDHDQPPVELQGDGLISFSYRLGAIERSQFKGALTLRHEGKEDRIPIALHFELEDPEEYARRQAEIQEAIAQKKAEQKAAAEAWDKMSPDAKVDHLMADIRARKSEAVKARTALRKLVEVEPIEKRRREVLDLLNSVLNEPDGTMTREAFATAVVWVSKEGLPDLIKLIDSEQVRLRHAAIDGLSKVQDQRVVIAIAKRLETASDQYVAASALTKLGPIAEKPILTLLDHTDSKVRYQACRILRRVGTRESIAALNDLAENDPDSSVRSAAGTASRRLQSD